MNIVEKANEVSVFGRWAAGVSQVTSPWEYSIRRNVPAYTKNITDDVEKIWSASSSLSWVLPRLGLLKDVFFKISIDMTTTMGDFGTDGGVVLTNQAGFGVSDVPQAVAGTAATMLRSGSVFIHPGGIMKLFSQFELRARNREIARMYPENIFYHYSDVAHYSDKHTDKYSNDQVASGNAIVSHGSERISKINFLDGLNLFKIVNLAPVSTTVANRKILTFYLEVPFSYFQRMGNALLTSFAEDISFHLICAPNQMAQALGPLGGYIAPGKISVKPYYHWIQPRPEEMAKLRQQMLSAPQGIPRLQFSCLSEGLGVAPPALGDQSISMKLNCPYPVARTLFWIETDVNLAGNNVPVLSHSLTLPVSLVEVSGSGTTFLSLDEPMLIQQMVDPPYSKVVGERMIYAINWSLLDKNIEMGGFLPTRNLNNLTMKVSAHFPAGITDAGQAANQPINNPRLPGNYALRVIHEYYVIEQTIPSNGQINVTAFD